MIDIQSNPTNMTSVLKYIRQFLSGNKNVYVAGRCIGKPNDLAVRRYPNNTIVIENNKPGEDLNVAKIANGAIITITNNMLIIKDTKNLSRNFSIKLEDNLE